VFEKLAVGLAAPVRPEIPPKPLSKKLALHHQDEMTQVRLGGFVLGNSGKLVTLETSSLMKFLRYVFQGQGPYDFQKSRTC
jgi:hypothetical protein